MNLADDIRQVRQTYEEAKRAEIASALADIERKWRPLFSQLQSECELDVGHDFQDLEHCVICGAIKPA